MGRKKIKTTPIGSKVVPTSASESSSVKHNAQPSDVASDSHNSSTVLSNMFAQSAIYFMKKESYITKGNVEADIPEKNTIETTEEELSETGQSKSIKTNTKHAKSNNSTDKKAIHELKIDNNEQGVLSNETAKKIKKRKRRQNEDEGIKDMNENIDTETNIDNDTSREKSDRTIFVGNVSIEATSKGIKHFFTSCGKVESVRLRSLPVAGCKIDQSGNQNLMKKVCANQKILKSASEGGRDTCNAYVTFYTKECVTKAIEEMRGKEFMGRKLRVDYEKPVIDPKRTIFVGNLPFNLDDEALWKFFESKLSEEDKDGMIDGESAKSKQKKSKKRKSMNLVESIRVIRDTETGKTKGFGYVLLKNATIVAKALRLNESKFQGRRELRIQVCGKRYKTQMQSSSKNEKAVYEGQRSLVGAPKRISLKRKAQNEEADMRGMHKKTKFSHNQDKPSSDKHKSSKEPKLYNPKSPKYKNSSHVKKNGIKFKKDAKVKSVKKIKPKHAARKARQAAEAMASKE